mmetsp:Transcript_31763/g.80276  ORF Transcript_31763/g.80276 Transcript_31763/m.80276 type:complete len:429 (+) Transcript_31763:797-2083(+)
MPQAEGALVGAEVASGHDAGFLAQAILQRALADPVVLLRAPDPAELVVAMQADAARPLPVAPVLRIQGLDGLRGVLTGAIQLPAAGACIVQTQAHPGPRKGPQLLNLVHGSDVGQPATACRAHVRGLVERTLLDPPEARLRRVASHAAAIGALLRRVQRHLFHAVAYLIAAGLVEVIVHPLVELLLVADLNHAIPHVQIEHNALVVWTSLALPQRGHMHRPCEDGAIERFACVGAHALEVVLVAGGSLATPLPHRLTRTPRPRHLGLGALKARVAAKVHTRELRLRRPLMHRWQIREIATRGASILRAQGVAWVHTMVVKVLASLVGQRRVTLLLQGGSHGTIQRLPQFHALARDSRVIHTRAIPECRCSCLMGTAAVAILLVHVLHVVLLLHAPRLPLMFMPALHYVHVCLVLSLRPSEAIHPQHVI